MVNTIQLRDQVTSLRTEARQWQDSAELETLQWLKLEVE